MRLNRMICIKFAAAAAVLIAVCCAGIAAGAEYIPFADIRTALFRPEQADLFTAAVIRDIRLPRVLLAAVCGALLAGAGAVFQGFFRNPLAESGIMGISAGAALGAALSGLGGAAFAAVHIVQFNITTVCAFCGAAAAAILIYIASKFTARSGGTVAILLTGTAAGTFFSAVTSIILLVKNSELHKMFVWTLGSFNGKSWDELVFILPAVLISSVLLIVCARFLDILGGGERTAQTLGLNPSYARLLVLGSGSLASAAAVCAGGTIGFAGLIAPHIARRLFSPQHRILVPASMLTGAAFLVLCDLLARVIAPPAEIPVGIITALAGAPFFISLLFSSRTAAGGIRE